MIRTFKHSGLKKYFEKNNAKGIAPNLVKKIKVRLNVLNSAKELRDVAIPGFDFHSLSGDRKGEYSIHVNGPFCLTFKFKSGDVYDLNLENYH